VIDRFLDEVFLREKSKRQYLILIGASHLNHVADQLDLDKWELVNLCKPGFRDQCGDGGGHNQSK
jgi:hypothetical protein